MLVKLPIFSLTFSSTVEARLTALIASLAFLEMFWGEVCIGLATSITAKSIVSRLEEVIILVNLALIGKSFVALHRRSSREQL